MKTLVLFLLTALAEIVGCYLPWLWLRQHGSARLLLPAAALVGAIYLLLVDNVSRLVFTFEIPTGILTSLIGIPFFVLVLNKAQRGWR